MSGEGFDGPGLAEWDPGFVESARKVVAPIAKLWFRAAVRGLESLPSAGGALVVVNYSGGAMTPDVLVLAPASYDFHGRKGYVRTAIEAGVPIVPAVSIGGEETQLFLTRGAWLAKQLRLKRLRTEILPLALGFPFGLTSTVPANFALPSKIVTELLEPIDIAAQFGDDPDVGEVDAHVRGVMQSALDRLVRQRRFPVLG